MRIRLLIILALMVFVPLTDARAGAGEKLTVLLDWFVNPDHAALIIARERGMFKAAGLEVELVPPADPSAPSRLIASGEGDIAITYQPQLHVQIEHGLPLVRIGSIISTPLNALVVLENGPVKSIADLKGKTVGFSVGGFESVVLSAMLNKHGLVLEDIELVNINFALSASLISGKVDAVIGAYRNFELNQLDIENNPGTAFYPEEQGVPPYDELIFVVRNDRVDDPRLVRFLKVIEEATLWITNHPDDGWDLFAKTHQDLNNDLNERAWFDTLPRLAKRPFALDARRYNRFAEFMKEKGMIKTVPALSTYAVALDSEGAVGK